MKRLTLVLLFCTLVSAPALFAQRSVDIIGYATWVDLSGDSTVHGPQNVDAYRVNFKSDLGYGGAVNVFWSKRLSTEFAAAVVKPDVNIRSSNSNIPPNFVGSAQMIPITGTLQLHFAPDATIDPYVGAGAAYVLFDDVKNGRDLGSANLRRINMKDDVGLVVNGGVTFRFARVLGLNLDAKYVPLKSSASAVFATGPGRSAKIDVNPLMLSAGLRMTF